MENKINIAGILKDCPKGMELDCTMYNKVTLSMVDDNEDSNFPIELLRSDGSKIILTEYGQYEYMDDAKCVIFPKGKTTWEGFVPPCKFKDGDIVSTENGTWIGITNGGFTNEIIPTYCVYHDKLEVYLDRKEKWFFDRLATEEEKQKLFDAIKENGYKWNEETKTLGKLIEPKFKVGDKIVQKGGIRVPVLITGVGDTYYWSTTENSTEALYIAEQDDWELVPDKFDINTLKPFDKVLMRSSNAREWTATLYSHYNNNKFYGCGMCCDQCIPYEHNEHLRGTTDDCDEFYKTWE